VPDSVTAASSIETASPIRTLAEWWRRGSFPCLSKWQELQPASSVFRGLAGSADAFLVCDLFAASGRTVLVLTENSRKAEHLAQECESIVGSDAVCLLPSRDAVPYTLKSPFGPTVESRLQAMGRLLDAQPAVCIAPSVCVLQKHLPPSAFFNRIVRLKTGMEVSLDRLSGWLVENGFRKEAAATDLGTFSIRGGLMDVYPFLTDHPYRLEFWGDVIESIREYNVFTQKSVCRRSSVEIYPMREFCFGSVNIDDALVRLYEHASVSGIDEGAVQRLEHQWKTLGDHEGIEWFLSWFELASSSIVDYLPPSALIVWDDILPVDARIDDCVRNYQRHLERAPASVLPLVSDPAHLLYAPAEVDASLMRRPRVFVDTNGAPDGAEVFECDMHEQPAVEPRVEALTADLAARRADGFETVVVSANLGNAERLLELMGDAALSTRMLVGTLYRGFVDAVNRVAVYTETSMLGRAPQIVRKTRIKGGVPITNFDSLAPGDYVVHVDHGIARFGGIERVRAETSERDCMALHFEDRAKLYVPVEDFHKVQKYVAKESVVPTLSRLGSASWERLKARTRESLKEMAQDLIELYAKRQYLEGLACSPDTPWQKEFEDAFIYEPTPDQLKAVADVKKDMESTKPMDRLVCGDVGFGKTEVAMRAAFKAAMSGYQVAVLAPTTILATQHVATFTERMGHFPVRLAVLSRFVKASDEKQTLERVKNGAVDILIGTHRILSDDVQFKNLGLLIVDEEQKFGVKHKEKLKHFRAKIDVLSMSATPIPRTLHMSLLGARDLSMMNTPPRNRLPVETKVSEYHDEVVKNAIERELERGGQVYFVHNRIKNLDQMRDRIEQLVPKARAIAAHGQMHEHELEIIMREFVAGRYDVLVSTVIIENGLDIANVNTLIVNRADAMGLSQLYQLRGRVGRSSEQAYAYLLTPPYREVDEVSMRRLQALEQYTELGSGFQIAMRDLEIRGAGNILGTRQHGFIAAVGFELYCRLLQQAIQEIKGEKPVEELPDVKIEIPMPAFISAEYISDGAVRVTIYQELSAVSTVAQVAEVEAGLVDRFGPLSAEVRNLLAIMRIKVMARTIKCARLSIDADGWLLLSYEGDAAHVRDQIAVVVQCTTHQFEVVYGTPLVLKARLAARVAVDRAREVEAILNGLQPKTGQ